MGASGSARTPRGAARPGGARGCPQLTSAAVAWCTMRKPASCDQGREVWRTEGHLRGQRQTYGRFAISNTSSMRRRDPSRLVGLTCGSIAWRTAGSARYIRTKRGVTSQCMGSLSPDLRSTQNGAASIDGIPRDGL
eukprot:scaffold176222_cov29-Tisochrysis_lutea.AAC.2